MKRKVQHGGVWQRQQVVEQTDLFEQLNGRWVDRVASEVAIEVLVRFEQQDLDALAGKQ